MAARNARMSPSDAPNRGIVLDDDDADGVTHSSIQDQDDGLTFLDQGTVPSSDATFAVARAALAAREARVAAREAVLNGRETSNVEAIANSLKLGPSAVAVPIGMPQTVRIIIEEASGAEIPPTGLPVSLNGKAYLIRPGEEVDVPLGIREILDNAIMHVPVTDPQTLKVIGHRKRLRFPYRRVA